MLCIVPVRRCAPLASARFAGAFPALVSTGVRSYRLAAKHAEVETEENKLAVLKRKLAQEKSKLKTLKQSLSKAEKREKKKEKAIEDKAKRARQAAKAKAKKELAAQLKEKAKEKKLVEKATKPYRRVSAFNMFVAQSTQGGGPVPLSEVATKWKQLSELELSDYQAAAERHNEEMLQKYTPKPKAPPSAYAAFVRENFQSDGREFAEVTRDLARQWQALLPEQKKEYEPLKTEKEAYTIELQAWTKKRLELYGRGEEKS